MNNVERHDSDQVPTQGRWAAALIEASSELSWRGSTVKNQQLLRH